MTELWLRIAMTSYYPNSASKIGVGWVAQRLANAIVERGHSVTMFSVLGSRFSLCAIRNQLRSPWRSPPVLCLLVIRFTTAGKRDQPVLSEDLASIPRILDLTVGRGRQGCFANM